jgi:Sodium/hydrogen exchanger family
MRWMDIALGHTISLLGVAILVAMLARRLSLPYTVGLVVTGIGLAVTRLETGAMLTHDFIFDVILPPLLFEAAINIHWRPIAILAPDLEQRNAVIDLGHSSAAVRRLRDSGEEPSGAGLDRLAQSISSRPQRNSCAM